MKPQDQTASPKLSMPPLEVEQPDDFETATFAMG
jgi:hypothetical protein